MNNQFKKSKTALLYLDVKGNLVFEQRDASLVWTPRNVNSGVNE